MALECDEEKFATLVEEVKHVADKIVDAFSGQHTNALDGAVQRGAPCSTSCVERSDRSEGPVRPVAVQNGDDPTNARPGGTPSGQARVGLF